MGAFFSVAVVTPGAIAGGGQPVAMIRSAASGQGSRPRVKRIVIQNVTAAQSIVDIYRIANPLQPGANMGTPSGSTLGQGHQQSDVSGVNVDTVWSSNPVLPTTPIRLDGGVMTGVIGQGIVLVAPDSVGGWLLEPGSGLLLWCAAAAAQLRVTPYWEE